MNWVLIQAKSVCQRHFRCSEAERTPGTAGVADTLAPLEHAAKGATEAHGQI